MADDVASSNKVSGNGNGEAKGKIACLLANGFEDSEFQIPRDRLRAAGYEIEVIGSSVGDTSTASERLPNACAMCDPRIRYGSPLRPEGSAQSDTIEPLACFTHYLGGRNAFRS